MATMLTYMFCISCFLMIFSTKFRFSEQVFFEDVSDAIEMKRMVMKTSHLHFYFHDLQSGKNPTSIKIITTENSGFGTTFMVDDALTEGPDPKSKVVGRAQGTFSIADIQQLHTTLHMVMYFMFTEGKYQGSSISILGRNHVVDDTREMPIVGGSGLFRFARGYALAHTITYDPKTGDAVVEYNVFVQHF